METSASPATDVASVNDNWQFKRPPSDASPSSGCAKPVFLNYRIAAEKSASAVSSSSNTSMFMTLVVLFCH